MLKKLGFLSLACTTLLGCVRVINPEPVEAASEQTTQTPPSIDEVMPRLKMPKSIIVCRAKQCAPANLSTSKEYIYNTLLHMLDSNARQKAPICAANPNTHTCTEEFVSLPVTIGVTPAYMYLDDVKITDVSISQQNTMALNLLLNWGVTYNGQTPNCKPSKTLLYAKNVNNVIMEDNGYICRMTTIGDTSIKTLFAIDYIDIDYGYIGGFYSIGLSGPAYGGSSGYMIIRLPHDVTIEASDFEYKAPEPEPKPEPKAEPQPNPEPIAAAPVPTPVPMQSKAVIMPLPSKSAPSFQPAPMPSQPVTNPTTSNLPVVEVTPAPANNQATQPTANSVAPAVQATAPVATAPHKPAPNVNTIIHYNHPARAYDEAKAKVEARKQLETKAVDYNGIKVYPLPAKNVDKTLTPPTLKNSLSEYANSQKAK